MERFEKSLEESQAVAERLRESQKLHATVMAAQARAQENLQSNLRVSQALIEQTSATAANLQTTMDEIYVKFKSSPRIMRIFGSFGPGILSAVVFSFIGAQNMKAGMAAFVAYVGEYISLLSWSSN